MDWKREAINDLRRYESQKASLFNLRERIKILDGNYKSIKSGLSDTTPVSGGGGNRIEDNMLNNIVERERLTYAYKATKRLMELVERGLVGLDAQERLVLERFFMHRDRDHVDRLMEELNLEKSRVYQLKDAALYKFTICMYGIIDY